MPPVQKAKLAGTGGTGTPGGALNPRRGSAGPVQPVHKAGLVPARKATVPGVWAMLTPSSPRVNGGRHPSAVS